MSTLSRSFYSRDSEEVARELLGKVLLKDDMRGKIVETEAYYGEQDPASHAFAGRTQRNRIMYGEAGHAYVYLCYGVYHLFNITTRSEGRPGAVLIRALEPLEGLDLMKVNRGIKSREELTNGPGKLTQALGIDEDHSGLDLTREDSEIRVEQSRRKGEIGRSARIGVSEGGNRELRFFLKGSNWVSQS